MSENNIDKLFKEKLAGEKVEFNPAAWTAAEELIASQSGKSVWYASKKYLILTLLLLISVGGGFWWLTCQPSQNESIESNQKTIENIQSTTVHAANDNTVKSSKEQNEKSKNSITKEVIPEFPTRSNVNPKAIQKDNEINSPQKDELTIKNVSKNETGNTSETKQNYKLVSNSSTNSSINRNRQTNQLSFEKSITENQINIVALTDLLESPKIENHENYTSPVELPINDRGISILRNFDVRFIAGGGAAWGARNPSDDSNVGIGYSTTAGINIGYIANSEFSFNVNFLYRNRTGLSSEPIQLNTNKNSTITLSLHYIDMPFYLNYHFDRHSIQLGLQYSYLLTTRSNETNNIDNSSITTWGKNGYFKNSDLAGIIGYNFILNEKLNIGARFNYGLFDITGNQLSTWETNDKNIHFNFMLEYKLSKY